MGKIGFVLILHRVTQFGCRSCACTKCGWVNPILQGQLFELISKTTLLLKSKAKNTAITICSCNLQLLKTSSVDSLAHLCLKE